jgi:hypothetical protein
MWKDRANALQLQRYTEAEQYGELAGRLALTNVILQGMDRCRLIPCGLCT